MKTKIYWCVYLALHKQKLKSYVGYTNNLITRWRTHLYDAKRGSRCYFHRAIKKDSPDAFSLEILRKVPTEREAKELEKLWIRVLNTDNPKFGYNMTAGGEGISGFHHSLKTKETIRTSSIGRLHKEETKKQLSAYSKNRSKEHKQNIISGKKKKYTKKIWVTDGVQYKLVVPDQIPENWYPKRKKSDKPRKKPVSTKKRGSPSAITKTKISIKNRRTRLNLCYNCFCPYDHKESPSTVFCSQNCASKMLSKIKSVYREEGFKPDRKKMVRRKKIRYESINS